MVPFCVRELERTGKENKLTFETPPHPSHRRLETGPLIPTALVTLYTSEESGHILR